MAKIIGYRQGTRQAWPVYDRPPRDYSRMVGRDGVPLAVGGTCPPHAPLTRLADGGYSCIEQPSGARMIPLGASMLDLLPGVSDAALQQMAQKTVEYGWPVAEEKLKPYLYMTAAVATLAYLGLVWLILRKG